MTKFKPFPARFAAEDAVKSVAAQAAELAFARGDTKASLLACIVANAHGVTVEELFQHSRSRAPIAATRQLAMYLMHVLLGRTLTEVGAFFGRDRTTVAYACSQLEEQREIGTVEDEIAALETRILDALDPSFRLPRNMSGANDVA